MPKKGFTTTFFVLIWLCFINAPDLYLSAQTPYIQQYDVESGLPFVEIDMVFFSRERELWATTTSKEYISNFDGVVDFP